MTVTWFFYKGPASWDSSVAIPDILSPDSVNSSHSETELDTAAPVNKASLTLILSEFASTKLLVRFAVRHFLRIVSHDNLIDDIIKDFVSSLKRLIFPRILRNSPLPEQVAIVESIAFMLHKAPSLFSIDDQTSLSFTAELLKMLSVAGESILSAPAYYLCNMKISHSFFPTLSILRRGYSRQYV